MRAVSRCADVISKDNVLLAIELNDTRDHVTFRGGGPADRVARCACSRSRPRSDCRLCPWGATTVPVASVPRKLCIIRLFAELISTA